MKNLKSFPFERNRYFYGKLLSVDDFETEQKYVNDKRRTINRFLFGTGVVCGLHAVEVDDESISVEPGLALDFAGREIVVDEPVIRRVAELEGYDSGDGKRDTGFYYLCLEYREEAAELMHNVAGTTGNSSGEYNKYKEGYRLFLTQTEPEREVFSPRQLYEESCTVYSGQGIRITQVLPRYLEMGMQTVLRIEIENTGQQEEFSFEYELILSFLSHQGSTMVRVSFHEKDHAKDQRYTLEIPLKAAYVHDVAAEASLAFGSFSLHIGGREYSTAEHITSRARISARDSSQVLQEEYYKSAMDFIVDHTFQQSIYLAKIYVVKAADACMIERIEQLPFQQTIMHTEITTAMIHKLADEMKRIIPTDPGTAGHMELPPKKKEKKAMRAAYGEIVFDLEHVLPGDVLYSDSIIHGLGFEPVTIVLGYEVDDGFSDSQFTVFGDASVFRKQDEEFEAALGAKVDVREGSFVIGMKVLKNEDAMSVKVHWTALRHLARKSEVQKKKSMYIQPDIPDLYLNESIVFSAVTEGFQDERLKWTVKDLDGGVIDKNGKYTAPENPGVFQINVSSTAYPEVKATTFVVVREKKEI